MDDALQGLAMSETRIYNLFLHEDDLGGSLNNGMAAVTGFIDDSDIRRWQHSSWVLP